MTINLSDNNPRANYTATSGQTAFTIPFDYFDDGDISVYQNGTLKTITTHYTISGSTVTLVTGATAGDKIAITRDVPLERTTDLTSTYNAASINNQLDTIVAQIADLDDRVSRSISLNDYEVGVSLDLPATADRLGKTIQFNSSTGALEVGPSGDELTSIASIASEITALDGISSNITSVAGYLTEINNVGDNIASVTSVSGSISSVGTVATNIADVNSVAGSITDLNDVADSLDQVELVATSISNVDIVGPAIANVNTVAGDITNINTLANSTSNIALVAAALSNINTTVTNLANINLVGNNIDDVNDVANVITKVTTVADNIANVNTVAPEAQYLSDVANNISVISTVGQNISDVQGAITAAANAATSESNAATSETNAATSASNASTSASNAAASASSASSAQTSAESARDATLAAFDSFDDRYLGAKTADPSVDNDGNALVGGALYYNSTDEVMKVYTGSQWVAAYASLSGALLVSNNLSDLNNAASARTNLGLGTAATTASTDYVAVTGDSMTGNLTFGDNNKAIFGAGSDLQIYHDGSHSRLSEVGTGSLLIDGDEIYLRSSTGENKIIADTNGGVNLFYDNSSKLTTTSTGIDVTGTVTADGLTVDTSSTGGFKVEDHPTFAGTILTSYQGTTNSNIRTLELASQRLYVSTGEPTGTTSTNRLFVDTNGDISFYEDTGTTPKFFWDASAERLGIGTTSPGSTLSITTNGAETFEVFTTSAGSFVQSYNRSTSAFEDIAYKALNQAFYTGGTPTERMRIDSSGNVNIATTSAYSGAKLSVNGSIVQANGTQHVIGTYGTSGLQLIGTAGGDNVIGTMGSSEPLIFRTASAERMRIDSSGNVGIGVTPVVKLDVQSSSGIIGRIQSTSGDAQFNIAVPNVNDGILAFGDASAYRASIKANTSDALTFQTGSSLTERMRIDSSGNLLVGMTSVSGTTVGAGVLTSGLIYNTRDGGHALQLNRNTSDGDIVEFRKDGTTVGTISTRAGGVLKIGSNAYSGLDFGTSMNPMYGNAIQDNTVDLGYSTGRFKNAYFSATVNAANFNTTSDATLKTNVETLTGSLDAVKAMRGVSYDWIESGNSEVGVIAQEVEAIVPDVVSTNDQGIKSVKYGNLVGVLIEAIKEQQAQIDELKAKLGD